MDYNEALNKLKNYLIARIPLINIKTLEKERVIKMVKDLYENNPSNIYIHSMSKGMYDLKTNQLISNEKTLMGILTFISEDIKSKTNVTYLLTDASELNIDSLTTRFLCDIVSSAEEKSCSIILISEETIWSNLRRLGMNIELDLPSEEEILKLLHKYMDSFKDKIKIEWEENDYKEASTILLGLSEAEIKNIISVLIAKQNITKDDLTELKFAKSKLFSNIEGLEKVNTDDITFGGLNKLKEWLTSKKKLLDVKNKENLLKRGIKPPRGILIVGVPGCGKSLTAKLISKTWNLPLFLLDFATIQGRYVGQSEEQLKEALKTAEKVSPCILWIDEIEKGLSGINDSSGVTSKMIGQFLFWLQECKKEVFVVATANEVDSLPPELLRKGRFDEIFFVDLPNQEERKEMIDLYFVKYLNIKLDNNYLNELATKTEGFASADIESFVRDISYQVIADNLTLTTDYIADYLSNCTSIGKTNPEKIEKIRKWGEKRAKNAS